MTTRRPIWLGECEGGRIGRRRRGVAARGDREREEGRERKAHATTIAPATDVQLDSLFGDDADSRHGVAQFQACAVPTGQASPPQM